MDEEDDSMPDIVCQKCGAIVELPPGYSLVVPPNDWEDEEPSQCILACPNCDAEFEVEGTFGGGGEGAIDCPKCKKEVHLDWVKQDDGEYAPEVAADQDAGEDEARCIRCGELLSEHDDQLCPGLSSGSDESK